MRGIEVQIALPGHERRLLLPTLEPGGGISSAAQRLNWWRQTSAAPFAVLEQADRLVATIALAASS
jgi:hypothetical protein